MHFTQAINIADLRAIARRKLPRSVFGFIDGGAHDERTLRDNEADLASLRFAPRVMVDVSQRKQAVEILGESLSSPMILGPTGLAGLLWPEGDLHIARATASADVGFCQSTNSNCSIEQLAQRGRKDFWFQLYIQKDRGMTDALIQRAWDAGSRVLVVTVDLPLQGPRERDIRNGFTVPPRIGLDNIFDYASKLGWLLRLASGPRFTFGNLDNPEAPAQKLVSLAQHISASFDASVNWKDLEWLRQRWQGRIAVKGILRADDAVRAMSHGADAVMVSNHGGRQLDGVPSAAAALPAIVDAVNGKMQVLMDGGIRRGSDIVKALALGADACLIGRAGLYGLASGGQAGVEKAIALLKKEIDITLALLGVPDVADLDRSALFEDR
jgi:L-lactate dehydrogenase (cytochrome)